MRPDSTAPPHRPDRRGLSVSVRVRAALLTLLPLLGLGIVFAMFWSSANQVGQHLARSQTDMRTAIELKSVRDGVVAIQLGLAGFRVEPGQATHDTVTGARTAAQQALYALVRSADGSGHDVSGLVNGLAALGRNVDAVLSAQASLGYDGASGLTGAMNTALDALEQAAMTDIDFNDPLQAAMTEAFRKLRTSQFKFAAGHAAADHDAFLASADTLRRAADASLLGDDRKGQVAAAADAALKGFDAWTAATQAAATAQDSAAGHVRALTTAADAAVLAASQSAEQAQAGFVQVQDRTVRLVAVTIAVIVAACATLGFVIGRGISRPIGRLADTMRRMAAGDLDAAVEARTGRDEIAGMTGAVLTFKQAALEKVRLERDAEAAHQSAEAERRTREDESEAQAGRDRAAAEAIASGLDRLSSGDLVSRLDVELDGGFETMRGDFNVAVGKLQQTMLTVRDNARTIHTRTEEIAGAAGNLSQRTEQQAASLEETATSLGEVTASVRKTAEGAGQARTMVTAAKAEAEAGGDVVRQAIAAMTGIEQASKQIETIIGVINEIAFQTNLLALNAGVEAARAGDAGRGFAVVASEVRGLAQRSADAAREIKALISASATQVEGGAVLVGRTGEALQHIVERIGQVNGIVNEIASSASHEASSLDQVNAAVDQMEKITQQNAAMVEETTAAAQALARETEDLAQLIDRFRTGEQAPARTVVPLRREPAAPPARRMAAARGTAALTRTPDADEWSAF